MKLDIKKEVKKLLTNHTHLRDNDYKLIATVWHAEVSFFAGNPKHITAMAFLTMFSKGKLTHPESIRRSRAKLQELHQELRGSNYSFRKKTQEKFKKDLKLFK